MTSTEQRMPPMGSENKDQPFIEGKVEENTDQHIKQQQQSQHEPVFERWKESFQILIDDDEGSKTFYEFLETEQLGVLFDCWYSCEQYRSYPPNKATAKEVYSRFVRVKDTRLSISDQARNNLALRLRSNDITEDLLLEIENEVFSNLKDIHYPKFLKSDFFTFYCETNGLLSYQAPNDNYKFGKPSRKTSLPVLDETSNDVQTSLTPYEKDFHRGSTQNSSEVHSFSSHTIHDSDKTSMAESRASCPEDRHGRSSSHRTCIHDPLPNPPEFRPRTQRPSNQRQMKPEQFAAVLTEKLNKVIQEREAGYRQDVTNPLYTSHPSQSSNNMNTMQSRVPPTHSSYYSYENDGSEIDTQSWCLPPSSERDNYSIPGASSHSGSGTHIEKNRNLKEKAEQLRNAVHHKLRNGLGECQCPECMERKRREKQQDHYPRSRHQYDDRHHKSDIHNPQYSTISQQQQQPCCCNHETQHTHDSRSHYPPHHTIRTAHMTHGEQEPPPPIDKSKVFKWLEHNDRLNQCPDPMPSPAVRRKKQIPEKQPGLQPIAQDLGMPLLPQPDTGNLLQEAKRVLSEEQHSQRGGVKRHPSQRSSTGHHMNSSYYDQRSVYSPGSYEMAGSMVSGGNWSHPDSASMVSYNPSQVSTVPSSASRLWNAQGYYESRSDVRMDTKSEARSHHSAGHHGSIQGSVRSEHRQQKAQSDYDTKSQATGKSYGSGSSKGRSNKNRTTVTYYFCGEPIPYRIIIPSNEVTLGMLKAETKKGNYRFFFKTISEDDGEVVFEEIKDDNDLLPRYDGKIQGKVEKNE